ncbi:hypothetical protein EDD37DRAFT_604375 [Exophiala viscosa]|uniref:uncharacterized protein n=1 Tax=Exophiala viscosa TaxID=2486360 RepID=UPI00218EF902|nr:hypothetical protein EDD37DRAFT_604375 [Exophiala viscosa]
MYQTELARKRLTKSSLSTELGLPSSIPPDAPSLEELSKAALPSEFVCATRIALESAKMSKLVDQNISTDTTTSTGAETARFGLLRMLESDLNALAKSMGIRETLPSGIAELSLLMAKINLCSFELNRATRLRTSDAAQLRLSVFDCATSLIQLFGGTHFVSAQAVGSLTTWGLPVQTFYPRNYWYGLVYACLVLMKLSLTNTLPEVESGRSKVAIQQAVDLLNSCSVVPDELSRVAKLIGLLRREAVQEIIQPRHKVHSRMGASLMYEIIFSVLYWKKRKQKGQQHEDSTIWPNFDHETRDASQMDTGLAMPDTSSRGMDELIASSGYLIEGWGTNTFDANLWDTSAFDQVRLAVGTVLSSFVF